MKAKIELAMLVRATKVVEVEVPDDFHFWGDSKQREFMSDVYDEDDGSGFKDDNDWCEEGTHALVECPVKEDV